MKLGNNIVQNMFGVPYPVLALEHLWVPQIIIQRLKMLAPIVHIQTTKGAQVLKLDMALQTCYWALVASMIIRKVRLPNACKFEIMDTQNPKWICKFATTVIQKYTSELWK